MLKAPIGFASGCGDLRELGVLGEQVILAREMFVHGLGWSGPDSVGVLPDLQCDVDQRDHDGKRSDDLSDIREVVESHVSESLAVVGQALRLPNQKAATGAVALQFIACL